MQQIFQQRRPQRRPARTAEIGPLAPVADRAGNVDDGAVDELLAAIDALLDQVGG